MAVSLLGLAAVVTALWGRGALASGVPQGHPSQAQVVHLQTEVRNLISQLDEIDEMHGPGEKPGLVRRHWQATQAFLAELRASAPTSVTLPAAAPLMSSAQCRLPATLSPDAYVVKMRDLLWIVLERLADAYQIADTELRESALRNLSATTYHGMQMIRGFGWMYGSATPVPLPNQPIPDSASTPAYLVSRYCGQCHAPPPTALHSANEWFGVAEKMKDHMRVADNINPLEITQPDAKELNIILSYLEANGCDPGD